MQPGAGFLDKNTMQNHTKTITKIIIWSGSVLLVLVVGIIWFPKEDPGLNFWGALYYSIRLFILEHDLGHFPASPPLVFIYFFAPMVAISALGTAITYFFRVSPELGLRWKKDHIIICGVGRTGKLLAETFREEKIPVIGVDIACPEDFDEWRGTNRVTVLCGDFLSRRVLRKAGIQRARAVMFASGDDLLNLEGVVSAYDLIRDAEGPLRLLWAHIASEKLADTARMALRTNGKVGIRFFDTYRIAATGMVNLYFNRETRQGVTEITIIGFGKFGRDLMEVLILDEEEDIFWNIRVVDRENREKEVKNLAYQYGISGRVSFLQSRIQDLTLTDEVDKAFFLCTDDDIGNLAAAMMLAEKMNTTHIYVRMAKWPMSAIEHHLREHGGIKFININDLVVKGIRELPGIFRPARPEDIKRAQDAPPGNGL